MSKQPELAPSSLLAFAEALNGPAGSLDAWLECNNEAEVRAHIQQSMARLHALNAELLEALRNVLPLAEEALMRPTLDVRILDARAAISKAEEQQ